MTPDKESFSSAIAEETNVEHRLVKVTLGRPAIVGTEPGCGFFLSLPTPLLILLQHVLSLISFTASHCDKRGIILLFLHAAINNAIIFPPSSKLQRRSIIAPLHRIASSHLFRAQSSRQGTPRHSLNRPNLKFAQCSLSRALACPPRLPQASDARISTSQEGREPGSLAVLLQDLATALLDYLTCGDKEVVRTSSESSSHGCQKGDVPETTMWISTPPTPPSKLFILLARTRSKSRSRSRSARPASVAPERCSPTFTLVRVSLRDVLLWMAPPAKRPRIYARSATKNVSPAEFIEVAAAVAHDGLGGIVILARIFKVAGRGLKSIALVGFCSSWYKGMLNSKLDAGQLEKTVPSARGRRRGSAGRGKSGKRAFTDGYESTRVAQCDGSGTADGELCKAAVAARTEVDVERLHPATQRYHGSSSSRPRPGNVMDLHVLVTVHTSARSDRRAQVYLEQLPTLAASSSSSALSFPVLGLARSLPSSRSSFLHPSTSATPSVSVSSQLELRLGSNSGHGPPVDSEKEREKSKERIKGKTKEKDPPPHSHSSASKGKHMRGPILAEKDMRTMYRNAKELLRFHDAFVRELQDAVGVYGLGQAFVLDDQEKMRVGTVIQHLRDVLLGHNEVANLIRNFQESYPGDWDAYEQRCPLLVADIELSAVFGLSDDRSAPAGNGLPTSATMTVPISRERVREGSSSSALGHPRKSSQSQATRLKFIKPVQRICKYPVLLDQLKTKRPRTQSGIDTSTRMSPHVEWSERIELGSDIVDRANEAMRLVVRLVNPASEIRTRIVRSALIASHMVLTVPPVSSASHHGRGHSHSFSSMGSSYRPNAQGLSPEFIASLGTCHLAASSFAHSWWRPVAGEVPRTMGGYIVLVKIPKSGKIYEPRYWFSSAGLTVEDLKTMIFAALCHVKIIWLAAIQRALAVPAQRVNERLESLPEDEKLLLMPAAEEGAPEWTTNPLPAIQSFLSSKAREMIHVPMRLRRDRVPLRSHQLWRYWIVSPSDRDRCKGALLPNDSRLLHMCYAAVFSDQVDSEASAKTLTTLTVRAKSISTRKSRKSLPSIVPAGASILSNVESEVENDGPVARGMTVLLAVLQEPEAEPHNGFICITEHYIAALLSWLIRSEQYILAIIDESRILAIDFLHFKNEIPTSLYGPASLTPFVDSHKCLPIAVTSLKILSKGRLMLKPAVVMARCREAVPTWHYLDGSADSVSVERHSAHHDRMLPTLAKTISLPISSYSSLSGALGATAVEPLSSATPALNRDMSHVPEAVDDDEHAAIGGSIHRFKVNHVQYLTEELRFILTDPVTIQGSRRSWYYMRSLETYILYARQALSMAGMTPVRMQHVADNSDSAMSVRSTQAVFLLMRQILSKRVADLRQLEQERKCL
ncbi:uncharacterized protein LAESUDRAFT_717317 [Laetiporus sulphureus 93-53]|uniref:DH domain-containing protein n=1 Tax=Laetiporus sulphureus 93-53 TaxID=1314785 RepID=A0A165BVN3_9APHY|nr:uncharacterized protein LAESUDRAFT_717317 [Laetiporus sulphureus 93-53]KZT01736.1 hypothetical protein LAESUDRAFT_717317 [Laetiporus sulphureus 93-53]